VTVLARGFGALLDDDEFADPIDREAALLVLAEAVITWRKSLTKG
jgi:hypothetical protein